MITHARVGSTGAVAGRAGSIEAVRSTVAYVASLSHSTYLLYGLETSHCIRVTSVHPPDVAAARGRPVGASRALIIGSRSPQSSRTAKSRATPASHRTLQVVEHAVQHGTRLLDGVEQPPATRSNPWRTKVLSVAGGRWCDGIVRTHSWLVPRMNS